VSSSLDDFCGPSSNPIGHYIFRLQLVPNFPIFDLKNWWGIFILIPSFGELITAILLIMGRHSVILAMINLAIAALCAFIGVAALYELHWNLINLAFAVVLILVGIGIIFSVSVTKREDQSA
jgi:hypothetical protein